MKSPDFLLVRVAIACVALINGGVTAAAEPATGTATQVVKETGTPAPPITFRILHQKQVRDGGRTVILNRVAPPVLPKSAAPAAVPELAAEADENLQDGAKKQQMMVAFEATVYDGRVTELRWTDEGKSFIVWSNIDFNELAGLGRFETEEFDCSLLLAIGNERSDASAENQIRTLPVAEQFSKDHASYFFTGENDAASCDPKTLAALDALHIYYDSHREDLHRTSLEREARRVESERRLQAHPAAKQNTVINFWPAENTVILDRQSAGGRP